MIEGVLRHCTDMEVDRQYTDTHGASIVGFAFAHMLDFKLMPRLKNIGSAKLYRPAAGQDETWPNLAPVLSTKTIDWDLIAQQYDQIVKYTTALRLGTAEAEQVLRRFTRGGPKHPDVPGDRGAGAGGADLFVCDYLADVEMRQEIHEGLQVVENWNSANKDLFYGKDGDLAGADKESQEVSMLALHLLQSALVHVNTLLMQEVLADPKWAAPLTEADRRALSPLFWTHVNPYGRFELDMNSRLDLGLSVRATLPGQRGPQDEGHPPRWHERRVGCRQGSSAAAGAARRRFGRRGLDGLALARAAARVAAKSMALAHLVGVGLDDVDLPGLLAGAVDPDLVLEGVAAGGVVLLEGGEPGVLEPVGGGGDLVGGRRPRRRGGPGGSPAPASPSIRTSLSGGSAMAKLA